MDKMNIRHVTRAVGLAGELIDYLYNFSRDSREYVMELKRRGGTTRHRRREKKHKTAQFGRHKKAYHACVIHY